jgi:hypothetical protein
MKIINNKVIFGFLFSFLLLNNLFANATTTINIYDENKYSFLEKTGLQFYCFISPFIGFENKKCKIEIVLNNIENATSTIITTKNITNAPVINALKNNLAVGGSNADVVFLNNAVKGPKGENGQNGKDGLNGTTTIIYTSNFGNTQVSPTAYINPGSVHSSIFQTTVPGDIWETYVHNLKSDLATITALTSTLLNTFSINATNGNITNLNSTNGTFTNSTTTNSYIQNGRIYNATIDNVQILNGVATLTGATITDLTWGNATGTNLTLENLNTTNLNATGTFLLATGTIASSSIENANVNSLLVNNSTITNLFATDASITNATITNLSVPNTLSSAVNVMTSNIGGSISTTTIINSNILNFVGDAINSITSTVNGVFSSSTINTLNNLSLTGSTTAVNIKTDYLNSTNSVFTNSTTTNATTTNSYIQNGRIYNATIDNVKILNGVATLSAATVTDLFVNNASLTNLISANATTTNFFAEFFSSVNAFFINLTATNATITNATTTNLYSTFANILDLIFSNATGTNLTLENLNTTNLNATGTFLLATGTIASTTINNLNVENILGKNATFTNLVASTTYSNQYSGILARLTNLETQNILATNSTITNSFVQNQRYKTLNLNLSASGNIGSAPTTVDMATVFNVIGTGALSLTIPAPTDATPGKIAYINNVGTDTFSILGSSVSASSSRSIIWTGTTWMLTGDGINSISASSTFATSTQYTIIKNVNQSTSGTALQNDNAFQFAVGANQTWYFNISARVSPGSSGPRNIQAAMSLPLGTTNCSFSIVEDRDNTSATSNVCGGIVQTSAIDANSFMNIIYTGVFSTGSVGGNATFQWAKVVAGAPSISIDAVDTNVLTAFRISGADLGEVYYSSEGAIPFGEIVSLNGTGVSHVSRSVKEYDNNALGIISTKPGSVLGEIDGSGVPVVVGLSGRVPVKVSLKNGEIKAGDYITTSDIPGVGIKATKAGRVVGKALTSLSGSENETGMVMVFIQNTYFDGGEGNDFTSQISVATNEVMDRFTNSFKNTFEKLSDVLLDMNLFVKALTTEKIVTKEICINQTCIVEDDLKEFLKYKNSQINTSTNTEIILEPVISNIIENVTTTTEDFVATTTENVEATNTQVATNTTLMENIQNVVSGIIENISTVTEEVATPTISN